jgi:hypothetical protein
MDELVVHKIVVLSDAHYPYHDVFATKLAVRLVEKWQPQEVVLNGDLLDFYKLSTFDQDPSRWRDGGLQQEIDQWLEWANELKGAAPDACRFHFLPGNHEDRLRRHLWRNPQLCHVLPDKSGELAGRDCYPVWYSRHRRPGYPPTRGRMTNFARVTTAQQRGATQAYTGRESHDSLYRRCHAQTRRVWTEESRLVQCCLRQPFHELLETTRLHSKRACVIVSIADSRGFCMLIDSQFGDIGGAAQFPTPINGGVPLRQNLWR